MAIFASKHRRWICYCKRPISIGPWHIPIAELARGYYWIWRALLAWAHSDAENRTCVSKRPSTVACNCRTRDPWKIWFASLTPKASTQCTWNRRSDCGVKMWKDENEKIVFCGKCEVWTNANRGWPPISGRNMPAGQVISDKVAKHDTRWMWVQGRQYWTCGNCSTQGHKHFRYIDDRSLYHFTMQLRWCFFMFLHHIIDIHCWEQDCLSIPTNVVFDFLRWVKIDASSSRMLQSDATKEEWNSSARALSPQWGYACNAIFEYVWSSTRQEVASDSAACQRSLTNLPSKKISEVRVHRMESRAKVQSLLTRNAGGRSWDHRAWLSS